MQQVYIQYVWNDNKDGAMFKHIFILSLSIIYLLCIGCVSSKQYKKASKNQNYVNPTKIQVDWHNLENEHNSPQIKAFLNYSKETHHELSQNEIPYAVNGIQANWNDKYNEAYNKYDFMRKYGVDCTRFLWHLYKTKMQLPFNSRHKNAPILSSSFAKKHHTSELKYFVPIKMHNDAFKPRTGDILAFPGHALAVLDAKRCIAIQSASWVCRKMTSQGYCLDAAKGKDAGVTIYKLMNRGDCVNGVWKQLDSPKNKFTAAWRHKALNTWIEKLPKQASPHSTIELVGYNIANRYIYFQGIKEPQKTSHAIQTITDSNGTTLDVVSIFVPAKARTGKLKIYWGNQLTPDLQHTVASSQILKIQSDKYLSAQNITSNLK